MKPFSRFSQFMLLVATLASVALAMPASVAPLDEPFLQVRETGEEWERMLLTSRLDLQPQPRDAFTDIRGTSGDASLKSVGSRPGGAYARNFRIGGGEIFTWHSKTPHDESQAESAFIVIHGVQRNAGTYFTILNNAWAKARDAGIGSASPNSIRVSPLFFSTAEDRGAYNGSTLGWGDSNAYTAGEASTNPPGSGVSSFAVLDFFLDRFTNRSLFPRMKTVTFVAHGGGAQMLQRYAVVGKDNPAGGRVSVRYVVGDASSMLYFTEDRPVGINQGSCPAWNDYRYGVNKYTANYNSVSRGSAPGLFKRYATRDVRYVVGLDDTSSENGDQFCMARGVGGEKRRNRTLAYWKYIHLLAGHGAGGYTKYPGKFPALDPTYSQTSQSNIPRSSASVISSFRGVRVNHKLALIEGAGHSASQVYGSALGRNALFGDRSIASGGPRPDYSRELDGYTSS